jgi:hypothetical protein
LHSARASASLFSVGIELTGEFCPIVGADAIQNAATMFRFHVGGKTALEVARDALAPSAALSIHTDRVRKFSKG